ncbi:hypothetical protein DPMN_144001 [Dreissena polymorpha]|uniref:Uncharacterized protein n=1 Tax=Dreissena polymorpha TaxID=45954 RepID=A0A9D4JNS1_DREPO|nr:hypothetical protein DPMN_144001 [Dreissena polymorpha]
MLRTGTIVTVQHATHWYHSQSPTCYALVPESQSNMLYTGLCHSPTCYALVPLFQTNMLLTGIIVTVQHATHWYHSHIPTCCTLVP